MQPTASFILCEGLVKIYRIERQEVFVLQGLDLDVHTGEIVAIAGASGSGKTTLLNILGGLDAPDAGICRVAGWDVSGLRPAQRIAFRRQTIGYLWQQSGRNLLPHLPLQANVETPMRLQGVRSRHSKQRALELLEVVGLKDMGKRYPSQLSGGEQQRAALAVALANHPPLLLADEPTGELDTQAGSEIITLLRHINSEYATTMLIVTHDLALAEKADRMIAIRDGRVSSEMSGDDPALGAIMRRESVVIDRVGRLQLPQAAIEQIPFDGRAIVHFDEEHLEVWPLAARPIAQPHADRPTMPGDETASNERQKH